MGAHCDLIAYQHARKFAAMCRKASKSFPRDEAKLADQLRRAADSVALNIAEGNTKGSNREFRQFLETARSSLKEAEVALELAEDGGLLVEAPYVVLQAQSDETGRTLFGLLRAINQKIENGEIERRQYSRNRGKPSAA